MVLVQDLETFHSLFSCYLIFIIFILKIHWFSNLHLFLIINRIISHYSIHFTKFDNLILNFWVEIIHFILNYQLNFIRNLHVIIDFLNTANLKLKTQMLLIEYFIIKQFCYRENSKLGKTDLTCSSHYFQLMNLASDLKHESQYHLN